jgi:hypothetical protein
MKASEMICELAKQIKLNGDRKVTLCIGGCVDLNGYEAEAETLSATWDEENRTIEIYGE